MYDLKSDDYTHIQKPNSCLFGCITLNHVIYWNRLTCIVLNVDIFLIKNIHNIMWSIWIYFCFCIFYSPKHKIHTTSIAIDVSILLEMTHHSHVIYWWRLPFIRRNIYQYHIIYRNRYICFVAFGTLIYGKMSRILLQTFYIFGHLGYWSMGIDHDVFGIFVIFSDIDDRNIHQFCVIFGSIHLQFWHQIQQNLLLFW